MKAGRSDVIDALDEIEQSIDILRTVYLAMQSDAREAEDFEAVGNVVSFTTMRIDDARAEIQSAIESK